MNLHDMTGNFQLACKYFSILLTAMPTDPGILSRLGQTYVKDDEPSPRHSITTPNPIATTPSTLRSSRGLVCGM